MSANGKQIQRTKRSHSVNAHSVDFIQMQFNTNVCDFDIEAHCTIECCAQKIKIKPTHTTDGRIESK